MACKPPYCRGKGGFCKCNCKCCPPPCCASVTVKFKCGTAKSAWAGPDPNYGCDCTTAAFRARNAPKPLQMPDFDFEPITSTDNEFVFALAGSCSVPCTTVTIIITTSGCCLELTSGGTLYTVGKGTVTATAKPGSGSGSCGVLTPYVNGSANAKLLADCTGISITLVSADGSCCPCCQVTPYVCGTAFNMAMAQVLYRQRAINKGLKNPNKQQPTLKTVQCRLEKIDKHKTTTL